MTHRYSVSRSFIPYRKHIYFRVNEKKQILQMPDYLGEDQRKTKQKDDKDDDKPIKGNLSFPLFNIR